MGAAYSKRGEGAVQDGSEEEPSLVALFTFVARDPITQKSMKINPLAPSTELQMWRFSERQDVSEARKAARKAGRDILVEGIDRFLPRKSCIWPGCAATNLAAMCSRRTLVYPC